MIRVLVVDDETPARDNIITRLEYAPEFEVCGQADNGHDALLLLNTLNPDVVFMDIKMPGIDGMTAANAMKAQTDAMLVFITAYEDHALNAFTVGAVDYLTKPIADVRFEEMLAKLKTQYANKQPPTTENEVTNSSTAFLKRLGVINHKSLAMVDVFDIASLETAGDYVCITTDKETHIHRQALSTLLELLDPSVFIRIHRSNAINLCYFKSLHFNEAGHEVEMQSGKRFSVSRRYQKIVKEQISKFCHTP